VQRINVRNQEKTPCNDELHSVFSSPSKVQKTKQDARKSRRTAAFSQGAYIAYVTKKKRRATMNCTAYSLFFMDEDRYRLEA